MKTPLFLAALLCGCMMANFAHAAAKEPGFRFANGWTLSPNLSLGAFWESNARDTYKGKEESGGGWRVQPTLSLGHAGRKTRVNVNAFYTFERGFESKDALDSDSYGLSLGLTRELTQHLTLTTTFSYSNSENDEFYGWGWDSNNPDLGRIDKDESENFNAQASLGYQNQRWQWSVGLGWARTRHDDYDSESDTYNFSALLGRAIGPRTYWNFSFSTSWDDTEYGGSADDGYYLMTGISGQPGKRLSYSLMAGVGIYDYQGEHSSDTEFGPTYNASVAYKLNRTFALSLAMSSQYEPEYDGGADNYYLWSHHLTAALNAQWSDRWSSRLGLSWSFEDHMAASNNGGDSDYDRTYYHLAFNTSYKLGTHTSVYGTLSWNYDDVSNYNKDDFRIDVGLSYAF